MRELLGNVKELLHRVVGPADQSSRGRLAYHARQVAQLLDGIPGLVVAETVSACTAAIRRWPPGSIEAPASSPTHHRPRGRHPYRARPSRSINSDRPMRSPRSKRVKEYIATQFVDFASADGIYRKYRVYFIGNATVLRHMYVSDHWNVHSADRARFMAPRPDIIAEERALIESDRAFRRVRSREVFREVRERMPLDFFGLDFATAPGRRASCCSKPTRR